jgi:hypothetical protein
LRGDILRAHAKSAAWILSLLLHAALLVAALSAMRHERGASEGLVGVDTRANGGAVEITLIDDSPQKEKAGRPILPVPAPLPKTVETAPPLSPSQIVVVEPPPMMQSTAIPSVAGIRPAGGVGGANGGTGDRETTSRGMQLPVPAAARSVVFVLDRSASTGIEDRIGVARAEIAACLRGLPPTARFQIVVYNRVCETLTLAGQTGLVPVNPQTRAEATSSLLDLVAEGGNDHLPAMLLALSLEPDAIIWLTDADDLTPELVQKVTRANRGRCRIHAVTIGSAPRQAMKMLADWNRGTCRCLDSER